MKSALYLLTALLSLTLAMPSAEPDEAEDDSLDLEERDPQGGGRQGRRCRSDDRIWYYRFPFQAAGNYDPHERVQYQCKR